MHTGWGLNELLDLPLDSLQDWSKSIEQLIEMQK